MKVYETITGGVTAAQGFKAAGVPAGIKTPGRRDVALLAADSPAAVAAVYTTNQVAAAPVKLHRRTGNSRCGDLRSGGGGGTGY